MSQLRRRKAKERFAFEWSLKKETINEDCMEYELLIGAFTRIPSEIYQDKQRPYSGNVFSREENIKKQQMNWLSLSIRLRRI